ncbi:hypothetical protein [Halobellus ruber]|uniref:Uncharacterized protein n=1 Tax=Halobellus ruber TaxID=2761102 RepID=A0A7J9SNN6_9EURY|nr:hypothetical protein [Halobellus ruber]MBB6646811.1 hypothetical protein [Halobellus ruber]
MLRLDGVTFEAGSTYTAFAVGYLTPGDAPGFDLLLREDKSAPPRGDDEEDDDDGDEDEDEEDGNNGNRGGNGRGRGR